MGYCYFCLAFGLFNILLLLLLVVVVVSSQTIYHSPSPQTLCGYSIASTLQIGDPAVIANECRVTTVGDFRMADVSVGGQGAPLMPYLDRMVLDQHFKKTEGRVGAVLNIGGISNIAALLPGEEK